MVKNRRDSDEGWRINIIYATRLVCSSLGFIISKLSLAHEKFSCGGRREGNICYGFP